ncbi:MAG: type II toxin-antitoxin system RelE/ParE family toxin [Acidobacteria bacterium]|nr:type II toxin-antitoxin system RelE/ParE family toxin [Acidobacteriota bacterium]
MSSSIFRKESDLKSQERLPGSNKGHSPANWKKLEGYQDLYRIRSGDYRIVYQIERSERLIRILAICDRKNLHRRLVL